MLLPSLVQVSESISGSVVPLAMFFYWTSVITHGAPSPMTEICNQIAKCQWVCHWIVIEVIFPINNCPYTYFLTFTHRDFTWLLYSGERKFQKPFRNCRKSKSRSESWHVKVNVRVRRHLRPSYPHIPWHIIPYYTPPHTLTIIPLFNVFALLYFTFTVQSILTLQFPPFLGKELYNTLPLPS